jgi:uncharacterized membrane protein
LFFRQPNNSDALDLSKVNIDDAKVTRFNLQMDIPFVFYVLCPARWTPYIKGLDFSGNGFGRARRAMPKQLFCFNAIDSHFLFITYILEDEKKGNEENEMTTIMREIAIDASKEKVWNVVADFGAIDMVSPGVTKSYLTSEQHTGVGTERHCDLVFMGATVEEKIIEWKEGESIKIDIYERKKIPLVKEMIAEFAVREEDGKTILSGTLEYAMTGGMGNLMNAVMMKKMNSKTWNQVLAGFKKHSETGEKVDKNTNLDLGAVVEIES